MQSNESYKTVFVMLRTQNMHKSCEDAYKFEKGPSRRDTIAFDSITVKRNLWSFAVEAVLEYCRINFDIFGQSKPISLISVDLEEKILTLWYESDQSIRSVWEAFSSISTSTTSVDLDYPGMPGLFSCKNTLHMPTPHQVTQKHPKNLGRVIVIGSNIEPKLTGWVVHLEEALEAPPTESSYLPIHGSEWIFIDISTTPASRDVELDKVSLGLFTIFKNLKIISLIIHSFGNHTIFYRRVAMLGGNFLAHALMQLAERNLNLVSTMVQDIPMKEEANSGSVSTMYGVELLHEAEGHAFLRDRGLASRLYLRDENNEMKYRSPPSGLSKTLGISWMAPRPTDNKYLRYSIGAFRVTMAAVANRSSVCLSQFILSGKSVLLGQKVKSKDVLSEVFLLLCHGNLMYLHILATSVPLSSPPNLPLFPEKNKVDVGKDADFRISQFINEFLIPSRLAPASASTTYSEIPKVRAHQVVERATRYWPLRNESSLLCGNKTAAPLFEHLPKDIIEMAEITACEAAIDNIIRTITSLPIPVDSTSNGLLCSTTVATVVELSFLLELYADISVDHGALLENFKKKLEATMYASHRLTKLLQKAKDLLLHGNPTPGSSLSNLTEVKRIAACKSKVAPNVLPIPELISRKQFRNITYTTVPRDVFVRQLLQAGRNPIKPDREFEAVMAAGSSKRTIPLYGGLKHDDPQK
ncbi:unnamed protein product [Rodentolepis nana]|uniref:Set apart in position or space protein n=1 Tax=Rodentolepis nana TaxID=102285 RepID=A0A158QGJ2_RODNA|nr:unnamed protein product [Rodentolepis nana]